MSAATIPLYTSNAPTQFRFPRLVATSYGVPLTAVRLTRAQELLQTFGSFCEAMFLDLAESAPYELAKLITTQQLDLPDLARAAEFIGMSSNSSLVRGILLPLLKHANPTVREAAVYGLMQHRDEYVDDHLHELVGNDPSEGVRAAAADALDD